MALSSPLSFEPTLIAGFALRAVPLPVIQKSVEKISENMQKKYPHFVERLADLEEPSWLINPIDMPFAFYLDVKDKHLKIKALRKEGEMPEAAAFIHASLPNLLKMMNGSSDGDALFFTRDLNIEGSTEAVVALRNAIDATGVDVAQEILAATGPLAGPAQKASGFLEQLYNKAKQDMQVMQNAITGGLQSKIQNQAYTIDELNQEIADLKSTLNQAGIRQKRRLRQIREPNKEEGIK